MKKEMNKKLLIFSSVLLCLVFLELILISAQTTPYEPSKETFFGRWFNGAFTHFDAKMILWLMMFILLLVILQSLGVGMGISILLSIPFSFILVAYVTPDAIIGVFRSYEALPLAFATFLPLGIFLAITYLSVIKASRALMTTQWLLWLIYGIFNTIKIFFGLWIYWDMWWIPEVRQIINYPADFSSPEAFWFWVALVIAAGVAWTMVFAGGTFMNFAVKKTVGMENVAAQKRLQEATDAVKNMSKLERDLSK